MCDYSTFDTDSRNFLILLQRQAPRFAITLPPLKAMSIEETSYFENEKTGAGGFLPMDEAIPMKGNSATSDLFRIKLYGKWLFVKRLKAELGGIPAYRAAFEKEFEIGFNLDHPGIVQYMFFGQDEGLPYIATQFVDGLTLTDFVKKKPAYFKDKAHLRQLALQLLSALEYMHSRQVVHLDLKPDNVMITNVGREAKIIDLGFSYSDLHQYDTAGHTSRFAAPEQKGKGGKKGTWTDIYAFAEICIFAYTGGSVELSKMPALWRRILKNCLNAAPEKRPKSAEAIAKQIAGGGRGKAATALVATVALVAVAVSLLWPQKEEVDANVASRKTSDTVYVKPSPTDKATTADKTATTDKSATTAAVTAEQMEQEHKYYYEHSKTIITAFLNDIYSTEKSYDKAEIDRGKKKMLDGLKKLKDDMERKWPGSRKRQNSIISENDVRAKTYIERCYETYNQHLKEQAPKPDSQAVAN